MDLTPAGSATPRYDAGARDYSPGLGTFTSLDPVRGSALDPASLNRYLYAHANPATLIDPDGHDACRGADCDRPTYDNLREGLDRCVADCHRSRTKHGPGDDGYGESADSLKETVRRLRWTPPSLAVWANWTDAQRDRYADLHLTDLAVWSGFGDNDPTVVALLMIGAYNLGRDRGDAITFDTDVEPFGILGAGRWAALRTAVEGNPDLRDDFVSVNLSVTVSTVPDDLEMVGGALIGGALAGIRQLKPVGTLGGASRASQFSRNWQPASLQEVVARIAGPRPLLLSSPTGKQIFRNPATGVQVVYDPVGRYFRVEDPSMKGVVRYLDHNGNAIPNNVPLVGPRGITQTGVPRDVRNALTHFLNSD